MRRPAFVLGILLSFVASTRTLLLRRPALSLRRSLRLRATAGTTDGYCTCDELLEIAEEQWGITLTESYLGPSYQIVARTLEKEGDGKGQIIGYTTGFITPPLLRQDTMQIYGVNRGYGRAALEVPAEVAAQQSPDKGKGKAAERAWRSQSVHGLSILMGFFAVRRAYDRGCRRAELLAINDDPRQHQLLVRHYQRLRFRVVREVGDDLKSVPDRLVWGGVGTLMEGDILDILEGASKSLRRQDRND
uniref:Uncharacterized protein n=1 Tax=Pinguiococcus pyrenoidosus TaxID=172671 RepID=A0A7R9U1V4_9STRA|mmetsp:Transcript_11602/g.43288  ORF Transcript_11602/g.43288 Transcript_11602/m.43288 type:complete len:247 (+) Transcript_11602:331-1071(+)